MEENQKLEEVDEETTQPEQPGELQPDQAAPESETQEAKPEKDNENFRRLRDKSERAERERDEAVRILKEMYAKEEQKSEADEDELRINDDDLVEGKHLSKFHKKIKRLEEQVKNYGRASDQINTETRLKSQYTDFDKVVNQDNIAALREQYPELADSVANTPNLYNKAVSAYTLIKKLGISAPDDHYESDRALAQKNASKPKPLASVNAQQGDSPLSRANAFANGLTDELKVQLRKEMDESRKYR